MKRAIAPGYDFFKWIVTLILLAIMVLRGCSTTQIPVVMTESIGINSVEMPSPAPTSPAFEPTTTKTAATPTNLPPITTTPISSPTAPNPPPSVTSSEAQTLTIACKTSMPSRVKISAGAQIVNNLNMRAAPNLSAQVIRTNPIGTRVEIIDGPVCTPKGDSAYLWWKIRLESGLEGWSAETSLNDMIYFLEPTP